MTTQNLPIPVAQAGEIEGIVTGVLAGLSAIKVKDLDTYKDAASRRRDIKDTAKILLEIRKGLTSPLDDTKKKIMAWFDVHAKALETGEQTISKLLIAFDSEQQRLRDEAARQARLAMEAKQRAEAEAAALAAIKKGNEALAVKMLEVAEAPVPEIVIEAYKPAPKSGASYREQWKFEIVNPELVPDQFWSINESYIGTIVRELKGVTQIPGIRVFCEKKLI